MKLNETRNDSSLHETTKNITKWQVTFAFTKKKGDLFIPVSLSRLSLHEGVKRERERERNQTRGQYA